MWVLHPFQTILRLTLILIFWKCDSGHLFTLPPSQRLLSAPGKAWSVPHRHAPQRPPASPPTTSLPWGLWVRAPTGGRLAVALLSSFLETLSTSLTVNRPWHATRLSMCASSLSRLSPPHPSMQSMFSLFCLLAAAYPSHPHGCCWLPSSLLYWLAWSLVRRQLECSVCFSHWFNLVTLWRESEIHARKLRVTLKEL